MSIANTRAGWKGAGWQGAGSKASGRIATARRVCAIVAVFCCASWTTMAWAGDEGVTDLSGANATAIESEDIVEALAVPRGTRIRPGARPTVRLPIYFESNSAELLPEAKELLDKVGGALSSSDLGTFNFGVEGHTDSIGGESYNAALSQARAEAVKAYLEDKGVASARLNTVGRGEADPVADNDEPQGRKRNRRVELINLGAE